MKSKLHTKTDLEHAQHELEVHSKMNHPNIIQLLGGEETYESIIIITPLAIGDLYSVASNKVLEESNCRNLCIQLLNGLLYLHETMGIIHGDIKPQNILLFLDDNNKYNARICDFGFSESIKLGDNLRYNGMKGSLGYFSPEQLHRQPISHAVDIFAFGVIVYQLLCGYEPFFPSNKAGYLTGDWEGGDSKILLFDSPYWDGVSNDAVEFVKGCLHGDPRQRMTARQALESRWISLAAASTGLANDENNRAISNAEDRDIQFATSQPFKITV